jgi:predicted acetylornithine/succinylornithine family transaminase
MEKSDSALLKNYARYSLNFEHGSGAYLYDINDKKYLDFLSGIAVTGFGHKHPVITKAVEEQINKFWHTSNLFSSPLQEDLASKLAERSGLDYAFFCNSGTEANEAALKFVRKFGNGRYGIISAFGGFHGRTMGSMAASGQEKLWTGFYPLMPGFSYVPFDDAQAIENAIDGNTIAVILEPIQGESGIIIPSDDYLKKVRKICDEKNVLLIMDEIQSGVGRTGKFFAYQWEDIKPDIVTLAKGIANGIPLGAVLCTKEIGEKMVPGSHGSTFGGNPIAVAAACCVVDLITDELLQKILSDGETIKRIVRNAKNKNIKSVRGKGLMIGIEFIESFDAKALAKKLLDNGLIVGLSDTHVIRLLPPFIITDKEIKLFEKIFYGTLDSL